MSARTLLTLGVFAAMLVLVIVRPRRWHEAWWTVAAALVVLALGLVTPHDGLAMVRTGQSALLFLFALLALAMLVGKSGFFDWAAVWCARASGGDVRVLYRNLFVLGAIVTALMSLDTTAVMVTPIVLVIAKRLGLATTPFVVLCAFVANVGSLLLPISNLTNLLFADTFHLTFAGFAARMAVPQLIALVVTYALLRWQFRTELATTFDPAALAAPVIPNRRYFQACLVVLATVLVGYFVAPLFGIEAYLIAFTAVPVLAVAGVATGCVRLAAVRELEWGVFPFVVGLFVVVRAVENLGIVDVAVRRLGSFAEHPIAQLAAVTGGTGLASNVMNNLPAALVARSTVAALPVDHALPLAALLGADLGPLVTPFGSLATILVVALARKQGAEVPLRRLIAVGLWMTPVILVATFLGLLITM